MTWLLRGSAVVLVVVCATWAYRVNYATQEALNRVADLRGEIAREREALVVLTAEWSYLNRPDRLRGLVAANAETLGLVELSPDPGIAAGEADPCVSRLAGSAIASSPGPRSTDRRHFRGSGTVHAARPDPR
jgi:hypothetical protein